MTVDSIGSMCVEVGLAAAWDGIDRGAIFSVRRWATSAPPEVIGRAPFASARVTARRKGHGPTERLVERHGDRVIGIVNFAFPPRAYGDSLKLLTAFREVERKVSALTGFSSDCSAEADFGVPACT